eukprot:scaffold15318_cov98-Cylindrotheca_fusiformis.AAC.1
MSKEDQDGSFVDSVSENANGVKDTLTTDPSDWSKNQKVAVAVGSTVSLFVILVIWKCCERYCRCCRKFNTVNPRHVLDRPYVKRDTSKDASKPVNTTNHLPLGAILHGAEKLRQAGLNGRNVKVAVIDTGVDMHHPGFGGLVVKQEWYRSGTPLSEDDHGTHVAGTIHFMAPLAAIYDYRVFGATGEYNGDIAVSMAIRQAVYDGCHIINMSLRASYPIVVDIREAVNYAHSRGVIMVCATGNSGEGDPTTNQMFTYPARWKETISVAAMRKSSSEPLVYFKDSAPEADMAAAGGEVLSLQPGGGYQTMSGTTLAAPHVSGLIAALMSNGSYRNKAAKLRKDLEERYLIKIPAKGKEQSSEVGFLTFLSKSEFETSWIRYAGMAAADNPSKGRIRSGGSADLSSSRGSKDNCTNDKNEKKPTQGRERAGSTDLSSGRVRAGSADLSIHSRVSKSSSTGTGGKLPRGGRRSNSIQSTKTKKKKSKVTATTTKSSRPSR